MIKFKQFMTFSLVATLVPCDSECFEWCDGQECIHACSNGSVWTKISHRENGICPRGWSVATTKRSCRSVSVCSLIGLLAAGCRVSTGAPGTTLHNHVSRFAALILSLNEWSN